MHHAPRRLGSATLGVALAGALLTGAPAAGAPATTGDTARAPGFTSTFTNNRTGWVNVLGNWRLSQGTLRANGIPGKRASVAHSSIYSDFYYRVDMWRRGNDSGGAANAVLIRGNTSQFFPSNGYWKSYMFQYTNNGEYSVWVVRPDGGTTMVKAWTYHPAVKKRGYNKVEIWADYYHFDFHINGTHLWSGNAFLHGLFSQGKVGVSIHTNPGKTSDTRITYAKLVPDASRVPRTHAPGAAAEGRTRPGGTIDEAPAP